VATITQVEERTASRANRTSFQSIPIEIDGAEVFAVAAVLPNDLGGSFAFAFKIKLAQQVTAIFTLDWALAWREKSALVFRTKYSHFRCSP
jgi:hypothetical protein